MNIKLRGKLLKKIMLTRYNLNRPGSVNLARLSKQKTKSLMNLSVQSKILMSRRNSKNKFNLKRNLTNKRMIVEFLKKLLRSREDNAMTINKKMKTKLKFKLNRKKKTMKPISRFFNRPTTKLKMKNLPRRKFLRNKKDLLKRKSTN